MQEPVHILDLFAGAGGLSQGVVQALEDLDLEYDHTAINHWDIAIETHRRNYPNTRQFRASVESVTPGKVYTNVYSIDLLTAGPSCTHWSSARGGVPVNEQMRMSPFDTAFWIRELQPDHFLIENVKELESWGPTDENGKPSRDGSRFETWLNVLSSMGYSVDYDILNAADYGDPTSRERIFIIGRKDHKATFPEPTHSKNGRKAGTKAWRTAAEIIDWSDPGSSIWTRDLEESRIHKPLKNSTMERIADGIRRHADDTLEPFIEPLEQLTRDDVYEMRETPVDFEDAAVAAEEREEPFLVRRPALESEIQEAPNRQFGFAVPYLIPQQSGGTPQNVDTEPVPTIARRGAIGFANPQTFVLPRNGKQRGLHSNPAYRPEDRPLHTVTAKNHDGHLYTPFLVKYFGNSTSAPVDDPLPTVTTKDRFGLVVPELYPWGLDLRYRMLHPRELAAAMGFPEDYEFAGNKTNTVEQIGNAVPVNLAKALIKHLLTDDTPSLSSYGTHGSGTVEA